ncbi:hypothetical protein C8R45DRAFT_968965 [Mycena sanguinolenta]|nr:hypothetical protein C8R45DRAFT_968965 [Mycena sanguinolenta]
MIRTIAIASAVPVTAANNVVISLQRRDYQDWAHTCIWVQRRRAGFGVAQGRLLWSVKGLPVQACCLNEAYSLRIPVSDNHKHAAAIAPDLAVCAAQAGHKQA